MNICAGKYAWTRDSVNAPWSWPCAPYLLCANSWHTVTNQKLTGHTFLGTWARQLKNKVPLRLNAINSGPPINMQICVAAGTTACMCSKTRFKCLVKCSRWTWSPASKESDRDMYTGNANAFGYKRNKSISGHVSTCVMS